MKVNNYTNTNFNNRKNQPAKTNFSGYFACPLKEVYLQPSYTLGFDILVKNFIESTRQHFDVMVQYKDKLLKNDFVKNPGGEFQDFIYANCWSQDNKVFLENGKLGIFQKHRAKDVAIDLAEKLNMETHPIDNKLEGGNFFLGKKQNGDSIILAGEDSIKNKDRTQIAEIFDIKSENIFIIPQPDDHIDLRVRPLIYPDVLVGDIDLTLEKARNNSAPGLYRDSYFRFLEKKKIEEAEENRKYGLNFASTDTVIKSLEEQGFNPIKVPGVLYKNDVNYMNALVHQNPDGTLVYITNKSDRMVSGIDFDSIFAESLKEQVPAVKKIIFMESPKDRNGHSMLSAYISKSTGGGLHCLVNERPDFEMWKKFLPVENDRRKFHQG